MPDRRQAITVTSSWARWRLKSPASRLSTQPFIQAQINENTKAPRHSPSCGEFTGDRWIPHTKGQKRWKCFHLMTSTCISCTNDDPVHWRIHVSLGLNEVYPDAWHIKTTYESINTSGPLQMQTFSMTFSKLIFMKYNKILLSIFTEICIYAFFETQCLGNGVVSDRQRQVMINWTDDHLVHWHQQALNYLYNLGYARELSCNKQTAETQTVPRSS